MSQVQLHERLWKTTFMLSEMKHFHAGQYVSFHANNNKLLGYFSIASAPKDLPFICLYARGPLHCEVGQELWLSQPQGMMTIEEPSLNRYILCAGGTGITPFLSIARSHDKYPHWQLHWSMVHHHDEAMLEHFPPNERSRLHTYLFSQENDSNMKQALIHSPNIEPTKYFLAGPMIFIEEISKFLLDSNIPATSLFSDLKKFH